MKKKTNKVNNKLYSRRRCRRRPFSIKQVIAIASTTDKNLAREY
jgi:hypothetical protein